MATIDEFKAIANGDQLDDGYFNDSTGYLLKQIALTDLGLSQADLTSRTLSSSTDVDDVNTTAYYAVISGTAYVADGFDDFLGASWTSDARWTLQTTGTATQNNVISSGVGLLNMSNTGSGTVTATSDGVSGVDLKTFANDVVVEIDFGNCQGSQFAGNFGVQWDLRIGSTALVSESATISGAPTTSAEFNNKIFRLYFDYSAETVRVFVDGVEDGASPVNISGEANWEIVFYVSKNASSNSSDTVKMEVDYVRYLICDGTTIDFVTSNNSISSGKAVCSANAEVTNYITTSQAYLSTNSGTNYQSYTNDYVFNLSNVGTVLKHKVTFTKPSGFTADGTDCMPYIDHLYAWVF